MAYKYLDKGDCPVCNREGLYKSDFYCNKCGQKLDWGGGRGIDRWHRNECLR